MNGHDEPRVKAPTAVNNAATRALKECKSEDCFAVANDSNQGYCGECFARMNRIEILGSSIAVTGPPDFVNGDVLNESRSNV